MLHSTLHLLQPVERKPQSVPQFGDPKRELRPSGEKLSWQEIARQCGLKVIDGKVHS